MALDPEIGRAIFSIRGIRAPPSYDQMIHWQNSGGFNDRGQSEVALISMQRNGIDINAV
jgi:hypothetical protein